MGKRGVVLIFCMMVVFVLASLAGAFYFRSVSESQLAQRFADSCRAFWLAEAGVAKAYNNLPSTSVTTGYLDNASYTYSAQPQVVVTKGSTTYYSITSTGSVPFRGSTLTRRVVATVNYTSQSSLQLDPSKFDKAIKTTSEFEVTGGGNEGINKFIEPDNSYQEHAVLDFSDLFGSSKTEIESRANNVYNDAVSFNLSSASQVTWVNVRSGAELDITGGTGSGLLIIEGDVKIRGSAVFNGLVYIIGRLTTRGNFAVNGGVYVESNVTVDTDIGGSTLITYNIDNIGSALDRVEDLFTTVNKSIVSWQEN